MIKKLLIIPMLLWCATAFAAGSISGITGDLTDGNSVVIAGADFGAKATAAQLLWDDFEDGADGTCLTNSGNWDVYNNFGGLYDDTQAYSGSLAAFNYVEDGAGNLGAFNTSYHTFASAYDEIYITYKIMWSSATTPYGIGKASRITASSEHVYSGTGDSGWSNLNFKDGPHNGYMHYNNGFDSYGGNSTYLDDDVGFDTWYTVQMYKKLSTAGQADGLMYVNICGINKELTASAVTRATDETFQIDTILLGLMYANVGNSENISIWIDDMYGDSTDERVMICDASTIDTATRVEPQPITAWADGSITVDLNIPKWSAGTTLYVVVVIADGSESTGYEIEVGETGEGGSPPSSGGSFSRQSSGRITGGRL